MTDQNSNYAAVLADLEAERDELNAAIAFIRRKMGAPVDEQADPGRSKAAAAADGIPAEIRPDTFFGMKIPQAIKLYLSIAKAPQRVISIARALESGGLQHTSTNFPGTVQTSLGRLYPEVVKVPNGYALAAWYPGRTFEKPTRKGKSANENGAE